MGCRPGAAGMLTTETLQPVIDELTTVLGDSDNAKEILALVKESYLNHTNLADATRHFVNALMGEYGLVILDPNERELKAEFASIIKEDLSGLQSYHKVNESNAIFAKAGYTAQVNPREVNLFYINSGQRYRLVKTDTGFATVGNEFTFSQADIDSMLAQTPEVFSPNVVLRPLYQETILPNICYVGGGGELAYWLQYKAFFNHYGYELPVLALRSSYMLVDEGQASRIEKFVFADADLFENTDALIKRYLQNAAGAGISFDAERSEAAAFFNNLSAKTAQSDATLVGSIEAEHKKLQNYLAGLEAKLLKAHKTKEEASVNQIRKLKESLFPNDSLQERTANFIP
ncbi:MAG: bacillithiol biosynthesis cysteine-adding enzyme BshC [Sphingobacteriales bacterium JAD_PAG50586_3]|nr:MAG: bacillithiol biosynthesis cysteine-adding enzyme BshC [Sphingobacteriales bacterium JAD_PAG50586_3]